MFVLSFISLILITGSLFQRVSNLFENNGHLYIKNLCQKVYAANDDDGSRNDDDGGDDSGVDERDCNGDSGGDIFWRIFL